METVKWAVRRVNMLTEIGRVLHKAARSLGLYLLPYRASYRYVERTCLWEPDISFFSRDKEAFELFFSLAKRVVDDGRFQYWFHDRHVPFFRSVSEAVQETDADVVMVSTTAPSHVSISKEVFSRGNVPFTLLGRQGSVPSCIRTSLSLVDTRLFENFKLSPLLRYRPSP